MLRQLVRRRLAVCAVVLMANGPWLASLVDPHDLLTDDVACLGFEPHDASAHVLVAGDVAAGQHDGHCWLCHWGRSFQAPPARVVGFGRPHSPISVSCRPDAWPARRRPVGLLSTRAPPAVTFPVV